MNNNDKSEESGNVWGLLHCSIKRLSNLVSVYSIQAEVGVVNVRLWLPYSRSSLDLERVQSDHYLLLQTMR